jgi:ribosomal protein S12 methylthiotransferase accessory factor
MSLDAAAGARAKWSFAPSPKVSREFPRSVPAHFTEERVRAALPKLPVTRVSELTPLDPLGLPVFSAVTPLARDLTTHMGKGPDATSARVSALMEAIERVSAERFSSVIRRASMDELVGEGVALIDPRWLDLPEDSDFTPGTPLSWVAGWELLGEQEAWLPLDLVTSPPSEGVLKEVDTNGLASGNTLLEAVLHGLGEVIERDAVGQLLFRSLFGEAGDGMPPLRPVEPSTLPDSVRSWHERIVSAGHTVVLSDITTEVGVATFKATLLDTAFPAEEGLEARIFYGYGADASSTVAARRALTEAVQSRVALIQAARDSFNLISFGSNPAAWSASLRELEPTALISFDAVPTFESGDLREDLRYVLDRLRRAGATQVIAADLTRPELGIPVVRVRVPGLTSFLGNRRRVGWRCLRHLL